MNIGLFYADDEILVVSKPCNLDFAEFEASLDKALAEKGVQLNSKPLPLYTIEKQTRGIVVFAMNEKVLKELKNQLNTGEFEISYQAVTVGLPKADTGFYSAFVIRDKQTNNLTHIPQLNAGAENFTLTYQVVNRVDKLNLVKIKVGVLEQEKIRFAMADLGMPIFGDAQYHGDILAKNTFTALNLCEVRFKNPKTNDLVTYKILPLDRKPWTFFPEEKILKN